MSCPVLQATVQQDPGIIRTMCSKYQLGTVPVRQPAFLMRGMQVCLGCSSSQMDAVPCLKQPAAFVCEAHSTSTGPSPAITDEIRKAMLSVLENEHAKLNKQMKARCVEFLNFREGGEKAQFKNRVMNSCQQVMQYEDPSLQQKARNVSVDLQNQRMLIKKAFFLAIVCSFSQEI
jgi:hypothetical protein